MLCCLPSQYSVVYLLVILVIVPCSVTYHQWTCCCCFMLYCLPSQCSVVCLPVFLTVVLCSVADHPVLFPFNQLSVKCFMLCSCSDAYIPWGSVGFLLVFPVVVLWCSVLAFVSWCVNSTQSVFPSMYLLLLFRAMFMLCCLPSHSAL